MKKVLLVILSVLLFSFFFYMAQDEKNAGLSVKRTGESFIEGLRIVNRKNGNETWTMTAKRADFTADGDTANLTGIEVMMRDRSITVQADKGTYDMKSKKLETDTKVVARGKTFSVTARDVTLDHATGALKAGGDVRLDGERFTVQGTGMTTDTTGQRVKILHDVHATFNN